MSNKIQHMLFIINSHSEPNAFHVYNLMNIQYYFP